MRVRVARSQGSPFSATKRLMVRVGLRVRVRLALLGSEEGWGWG